MAITKENKTIQVDVYGEYKIIQHAYDVIIKEDNDVISTTRYRTSFHPTDDISNQPDEVKEVANAVWTDEIKKKWSDMIEAQEAENKRMREL